MVEMPPNNQNPAPPPGQFDPSQFDFIMNPPQQKRSLIPGGPTQRILIFIAGAGIGLVLILFLFFAIFGGDDSVDQLVPIAQRQTEIVRISSEASRKAGGPQAQKLATLTNSVIATDQKNTIDYMAKNGRKINQKELALGQSAKTDEELSAAEQNGRFDEVYIRITLDHLQKYQQSLESVYPTLGKQGQELFDQNLKNVELILEDNQAS